MIDPKEIAPYLPVVPHTASVGLGPGDLAKRHTNTGAGAEVILTLPNPAGLRLGSKVFFAVTAAQYLRVANFDGTTQIWLGTSVNGQVSVAGGYVRSNQPQTNGAVGSMLELELVAPGMWFGRVTGDWKADS